MKNIVKLALILFLICAVMTLVLAFVNEVTAPIIANRQQQDQIDARRAVLPAADAFAPVETALSGSVTEVYVGTQGDVPVGYAINVAPDGYGGKIQAIVGVDGELNVTGIQITELSETPGLGAKVNGEDFLEQYLGKGAEEFTVVKSGAAGDDEITAVSGATISSRAMTSGVNDALAIAKQLKEAGE